MEGAACFLLANYNKTRGPVHEFIHEWGLSAWPEIEAYGGEGAAGWGKGPCEVARPAPRSEPMWGRKRWPTGARDRGRLAVGAH